MMADAVPISWGGRSSGRMRGRIGRVVAQRERGRGKAAGGRFGVTNSSHTFHSFSQSKWGERE